MLNRRLSKNIFPVCHANDAGFPPAITTASLFFIYATLSDAVLPFPKLHIHSWRGQFVRAYTSNYSAILDCDYHAVRLFGLKLHTGLAV